MAFQLEITGGYNAETASALAVATALDATIGAAVQAYTNQLSAAFTANPNTLNLDDFDIATGHENWLKTGAAGTVEELTNTDSLGGVSAGVVTTGTYATNPTAQAMIIEAPGTFSVQGAAATILLLCGANSNVTYTVNNPSLAGASLIGGGGKNVFNVESNASVYVISAGADTVNLTALGYDTMNAYTGADDLVSILEGSSTITANGNATMSVTFAEHAGGNLTFINDSSTSQTVFSGAYTQPGGGSVFAPNSVTAFGGAGGGYYVGGLAGNNSLGGGAGDVTLQAGGSGDLLEATGGDSGGGNVFFSGNGVETLAATAGTGANFFQLGGPYTGKGAVTTSGSTSTAGAGAQIFFIGNVVGETITGSAVSGATNTYVVLGDSTTGGATFTISNFTASPNAVIYLANGSASGPSDAHITIITADPANAGSSWIGLSDGTLITLLGVTIAQVKTATFSNGITAISA
jgi:hypothetical protein